MAEMVRVRPVEYQSPRPLILAVCFLWGIIVGFGLNFFRASEQVTRDAPAQTAQPASAERTVPSELERRRQDIPNLAEVEPAPVTAPLVRPTIADIEVEPPALTLTTEGGLTGLTADPLGSRAWSQDAPQARPSSPALPPPIPDLPP